MIPTVHHPDYCAPIDPDHRFPMAKFARLAERLLADGLVAPGGFFEPIEAPRAWLELAHTAEHVTSMLERKLSKAHERAFGLPVTPEVIRRGRLATGGTVLTARLAIEHGIACNTAGGSHHASADQSRGFCTFNDVAVAARLALAEGLARRILVVDLDVHQGDGTAEIFAEDPRVITLSAHAAANYPHPKANSDIDIALDDHLRDAPYLNCVLDRVEATVDDSQPDLIFYNAGVDIHADDRLGRLMVSERGIEARDEAVLGIAKARGLPIAVVIGGGYDKDIDAVARRHSLVHHSAAVVFHDL